MHSGENPIQNRYHITTLGWEQRRDTLPPGFTLSDAYGFSISLLNIPSRSAARLGSFVGTVTVTVSPTMSTLEQFLICVAIPTTLYPSGVKAGVGAVCFVTFGLA